MRSNILVLLLCLLPLPAAADYLYSAWRDRDEEKPYVYVILDTSGSMSETDSTGLLQCPYGRSGFSCKSRFTGAKEVLQKMLPTLSEDVGLGLGIYSPTASGGIIPSRPTGGWSKHVRDTNGARYCGMKTAAPLGADYDTMYRAIRNASADSNTPLAWSLEWAHQEIKNVRKQGECRDYYVLLLTDGEESCYGDEDAAVGEIEELRADGIRTFVVGFGRDVADSTVLSRMARAGSTATRPGAGFPCWDSTSCGDTSLHALFASQSGELEDQLTRAFEEVRKGTFSVAEPVIGSVPTRFSEIDRVARNFMVYSAFSTNGDLMRGHLYGLRLFGETSEYSGRWEFTDLSPNDLLSDCGENKPCLFDAGVMLQNRTQERRILTAMPGVVDRTEGSLSVRMSELVELPEGSGASSLQSAWARWMEIDEIARAHADAQLPPNLALTGEELRAPDAARMQSLVSWLHGSTREWKLADIYHSSPTIVEPPSMSYVDRGYPEYRRNAARRPWMIYVGANDGMIHAFYASPDFDYEAAGETAPRWQPGEEAWAYMPMNLVGRALHEVASGSERFFSMDLSCRYMDAILDDKVNFDGELDCGDDPNCGWGTILICGQGWGGSWYVALDVTDPSEPKPMWELTIPGPEIHGGSDESGLGRTWSVPSLARLNFKGKPMWAGIFGNGYNSDMKDCPSYKAGAKSCSSTEDLPQSTYGSYRLGNLPFAGQYPNHGDGTSGDKGHAWVIDLVSGQVLKTLHAHANGGTDAKAILADGSSIDSDANGFTDAAYLGGMSGSLYRISFGDKKTEGTDDIVLCAGNNSTITNLGSSRPITSNPAVVSHPTQADKVHLFLGSGIDGGTDPDQQANNGNQWDFRAFLFTDTGAPECLKSISNAGNFCKQPDWKLGGRARLLGQPLFSRQTSGRDWVLYSTWAPGQNQCESSGVAELWCLDVSNPEACTPCGSLDGDDSPDRSVVVDTGGLPPSPPVMADQVVYIGPSGTPITDIEGNTPEANSRRPRVITLSWREVF